MKKEDRPMTVKEMYKRYKDIINFAIIFLVIVPVCMYILALTPSSIGFIEPEDARAWLTYYGSIIGGGMTRGVLHGQSAISVNYGLVI